MKLLWASGRSIGLLTVTSSAPISVTALPDAVAVIGAVMLTRLSPNSDNAAPFASVTGASTRALPEALTVSPVLVETALVTVTSPPKTMVLTGSVSVPETAPMTVAALVPGKPICKFCTLPDCPPSAVSAVGDRE